MRVKYLTRHQNFQKDSLHIITKDYFYCTCFFQKSKKLLKNRNLPMPKLLIHEP